MDEKWLQVAGRIDGYQEQMVRLQAELVACPALGPTNGGRGELEKAELLDTWCQELSPDEVIWINAPDDRVPAGCRPNYLTLFNGQSRIKTWILSHLDVVPPGERSLWESEPFVLRREGDSIIGRGVEDNHQGIVASYFAVKALREEKVIPAHDLGLIFVADEETGSNYGLQHVLETRPDLFSPEDLIIVPDAGNEEGTLIEIAEKSMLWIRFTLTGKQCHASTPHKGLNTLRAAARMITALDQGLPETFDGIDELFRLPRSTFEPTKKEANVPNINTIPGEDVFHFDCRVLPQYDLGRVIDQAVRIAEITAGESGVAVKVEPIYQVQAPPATSIEAPVVAALQRAILTVHGKEARPQGIGGGTVAAFFRQKGLPAAVWSTITGSAHAPNEHTLLSNLIADAKVMAHVFMGL